MTDQQRQAANQALEALEGELWLMLDKPEDEQYRVKYAYLLTVITALRTALVQQAEPVAWAVQACSKMWRGEFAEIDAKAEANRIGGTCVAFPLYTTPPQRPWVGLTEEEVKHLYPYGRSVWGKETFEAIEKALKDKNT